MRRILSLFITLLAATATRSAPPDHAVVFHEPDTFAGWPANGGSWSWDGGQEVLVGFATGKFVPRDGHNILPPYTNRLARTTDGGKTWKVEQSKGYFQPGDKPQSLRDPIPFADPDLAIRFIAEGYHGGTPTPGVVTFSRDRGRTWTGPFALPPLVPESDPSGRTEITLRTDYQMRGKDECLVFGSARLPGKSGSDRAFACKLTDGGRSSIFLGWVAPIDSPNRAAMPSTISLAADKLLTAIRVRKGGADENWIDGYLSTDDGRKWKRVGRIGETGAGNGNPPALLRLSDGRTACAYGDRTRKKLFLRLSSDDGMTWGDEVTLRDDYQPDARGEIDFGYPRAFQRKDGAVVVVYYWATKERPTNHITATTWSPDEKR